MALLPSGHGYFPHLTRASSTTIIPSRASNSGHLQAGLLVKRGYGVATPGKAKLDISPPSPEFFFQVWCGGGPRPRKPRVWRTKQRKGTVSKSQKLLDHIKGLSNVKEEVYGALDTFIAWELEFPLVTVKKALTTLKHEGDWQRVIQISKWMLSKGQGRTFGSYLLLLEAFDITNRDEEAEELWQSIFLKHLEVTPRIMFSTMISFYYKRDKFDELLELFASMEELQVRPDQSTVDIVAQVYEKLGSPDKAEKARNKYPPPKWEYRYNKGKRIRVRTFPDVQVNNAHSDGKISDEHYSEEGRDFQENEYGTESRIQSGDVEEESIFTEDDDSFITEGVRGRRNSDEKHYSLENSDFGEEIRIKNSVDETNISTEDDPNRTVLVDDLSKQNQPKMSASTSYSSRSAFVNL